MPKSTRQAFSQSRSEAPFNCEADGLFHFLKEVKDQADKMGSTEGILSITKNIGETNKTKEDFLSNYGTLTLVQVVASEADDAVHRWREWLWTGHVHALQTLDGMAHQQGKEEDSHFWVRTVHHWRKQDEQWCGTPKDHHHI
jgi:hypothetical protein